MTEGVLVKYYVASNTAERKINQVMFLRFSAGYSCSISKVNPRESIPPLTPAPGDRVL